MKRPRPFPIPVDLKNGCGAKPPLAKDQVPAIHLAAAQAKNLDGLSNALDPRVDLSNRSKNVRS